MTLGKLRRLETTGPEQPQTPDPPQQPGGGGATPTLTRFNYSTIDRGNFG